MRTSFDALTAECLVFTFKAGWASAIGHDLKLRVESFTVDFDPTSGDLEARFDAGSIRYVCAVQHGREEAGALSRRDRRKVEEAIVSDVLDARRHPEIRFAARGVWPESGRFVVVMNHHGELTLRGRTEPLRVEVETTDDGWRAHAVVHQPRWGIEPYKAMLGALRIQPDVDVHLTLRR